MRPAHLLAARGQRLAQPGHQRHGGGLQVVARATNPGSAAGACRAQRGHQGRVQLRRLRGTGAPGENRPPSEAARPPEPARPPDAARPSEAARPLDAACPPGRGLPGPEPGRTPRTPRGWTAARPRTRAPTGTSRRPGRGDPVAAAQAHGRPAEQREPGVAAHPGGHLGQFLGGSARRPTARCRRPAPRPRRRCRPPPGRDRDPLPDLDGQAGRVPDPGPTASTNAATARAARLSEAERHAAGALPGDHHAVGVRDGKGGLIEQRQGMERGHQVVVAIRTGRAHRELEIHLRGHPRGHSGHDSPRS